MSTPTRNYDFNALIGKRVGRFQVRLDEVQAQASKPNPRQTAWFSRCENIAVVTTLEAAGTTYVEFVAENAQFPVYATDMFEEEIELPPLFWPILFGPV